jgi:YVTN family beta-propeller protein
MIPWVVARSSLPHHHVEMGSTPSSAPDAPVTSQNAERAPWSLALLLAPLVAFTACAAAPESAPAAVASSISTAVAGDAAVTDPGVSEEPANTEDGAGSEGRAGSDDRAGSAAHAAGSVGPLRAGGGSASPPTVGTEPTAEAVALGPGTRADTHDGRDPRPDAKAPAIPQGPPSDLLTLVQTNRIVSSGITPKSIVYSGDGLFFAQNMMYRHTVTVYDRDANLVATIEDSIEPTDHGLAGGSMLRGAPVEAAFTSDGRYAYVTNYRMYGPGYGNAGGDACDAGSWDESFVYRIDTRRLEVDQVIGVGAVPKHIAVTPDDSRILVTNWCGFDVSVIDVASGTEIDRVPLGRHPRGIAIDPSSEIAYVAVMGSSDIAVLSIDTADVDWFAGVGANPRHLVLSPDGTTLYATLNGEGTVAKIDTSTGTVTDRVRTGEAPRTMELSADGRSLYVVNYASDTVSKIGTENFDVIQTLEVADKPIGITFDPVTRSIWVASYSGVITTFADRP